MATKKQVFYDEYKASGYDWHNLNLIIEPFPEGVKFSDEKGREIYVGALVVVGAELEDAKLTQAERIANAEKWHWPDSAARDRYTAKEFIPHAPGIVTYISDFDGDVDDEGRTYGINPKVYVRWLDNWTDDKESFSTNNAWNRTDYYNEPNEMDVDDLINVSDVVRNYSNMRGER
jgi:hypothetical protein